MFRQSDIWGGGVGVRECLQNLADLKIEDFWRILYLFDLLCFLYACSIPEMEFLNINFTKDSSLLLPVPSNGGFLKSLEKTAKHENARQKTRQKLESAQTRVYAPKPRLKMPLKNSISAQNSESTVHIFEFITWLALYSAKLQEHVLLWSS